MRRFPNDTRRCRASVSLTDEEWVKVEEMFRRLWEAAGVHGVVGASRTLRVLLLHLAEVGVDEAKVVEMLVEDMMGTKVMKQMAAKKTVVPVPNLEVVMERVAYATSGATEEEIWAAARGGVGGGGGK